MTGLYGRCMFNFLRNCQTAFLKLKTSSVMYERSSCSTCSSAFHVASLLNFNHASGYMVAFHSGFNLRFPDDQYYRAPFHVLTGLSFSSLVKRLFKYSIFFFFFLQIELSFINL